MKVAYGIFEHVMHLNILNLIPNSIMQLNYHICVFDIYTFESQIVLGCTDIWKEEPRSTRE